MKKNIYYILTIILTLNFSFLLYGEELVVDNEKKAEPNKKGIEIDIESGFERYFLYTQYQIGGKVVSRDGLYYYHFPVSELKFPLDFFMFYFNFDLIIKERFKIYFNVKKNITKDAGEMEDSDWLLPKMMTTYSKSKNKVNAIITDFNLMIMIFKISFFSMDIGAGFTYQYMNFSCSDVQQLDISFGTPIFVAIPGKGLTYKVEYFIPNIKIRLAFKIKEKFKIIPAIWFSPYVKAKDVDDHLLRAKKSKSDSAGLAALSSLRIRYIFKTNITISMKLDYLYLRTRGKQKQSYYLPVAEANFLPGWYANIDNELESHQLSISLGAGYSFQF